MLWLNLGKFIAESGQSVISLQSYSQLLAKGLDKVFCTLDYFFSPE